jgi:hypothetical protein
MLSSRVAPSSMAKLPETELISGALKKRHVTSPRRNTATCVASTRMTAASTG